MARVVSGTKTLDGKEGRDPRKDGKIDHDGFSFTLVAMEDLEERKEQQEKEEEKEQEKKDEKKSEG